ncbi:MAG: hypothetical protein Q4E34_01035 [Synergistaceae bacterium]|nr:hypothetical protein [Synergistaceae bacterium]
MTRLITSDTKLLVSEVATSSSTTPTTYPVGGMSGWTLNENRSAITVTGVEDENQKYRAGIKDCQGTFELNIDDDDDGQELIKEAAANGTSLTLYYREEGTGASKPQMKVDIQITDYGTNGGVDAALTRSVSWVAAGAVDHTAQPTG